MLSQAEKNIFNRSELLLGANEMERIQSKRVIILGVGGVGSWCAESLIRNGIKHLTLVDSDCVCITNCNRQLMATTRTVGQSKVEVLKQRLLEINPQAKILALQEIYSQETADMFHLETYDYVIDAIDSLKDKVSLILHATSLEHTLLFSSMGAALRIDPTQIRVCEFWKVRNDTLGSALRKRMRRDKTFPAKKFLCVYSEEMPMANLGESSTCEALGCSECIKGKTKEQDADPSDPSQHDWNAKKAQINGSLSHITGIFGMTLAGLVMQDITNRKLKSTNGICSTD